MFKRLRIPTYFLILSSIDLRWEELSHIMKILCNLGLSDEGLTDLSYQERCNLLHKNPVLAAKHFKEKVEVISKDIIVNGPLCKKKIYYAIRIEFHEMGSTHIHCFIRIFHSPNIQNNALLSDH